MIRIPNFAREPIADDLAKRMIDAIDRGLYRIEPTGPSRMTANGLTTDPVSHWNDQTLDLAKAAATLKWHKQPRGKDESVQAASTGITISRSDPNRLPEIGLGDGLERWIDHSIIAPHLCVMDRIMACEQIHLAIAKRVLSCPAGDEAEADRINRILEAAIVSAVDPDEPFESLRITSGNEWSGPLFEKMMDDDSMQPLDRKPDHELLDSLPLCIAAQMNLYSNAITTGPVVIEDYQTWLEPDDMPDTMEVIRTLADMKLRT